MSGQKETSEKNDTKAEHKTSDQILRAISTEFDSATLQSFGFWVLGLLSVSAAFSFGVYSNLPLGVQSIVGMEFVTKQTANLGLQVGAALAFGKIVSGTLLGLNWIPRISPGTHAKVRTVVFVTVSGLSAMLLVTFHAFDAFTISNDWAEFPLIAYAVLVCIFFWIIAAFRAKKNVFRWLSNGLLITVISLAIWISFALGQARLQKIMNHDITFCLTGGRTLTAAPIAVNRGMFVLYQGGAQIYDGFQIGAWGAIPTSEIVMTLEVVDIGQGVEPIQCGTITEVNTQIRLQSD